MERLNYIFVFFFVLFAACANDTELSKIEKGEVVSTQIQLEISDLNLPSTKGVGDEIGSLHVFLFNGEGLYYYTKATVNTSGSVNANLPATKESVYMMLIANMDRDAEGKTFDSYSDKMSKEDILKKLIFNASDYQKKGLTPMWGETRVDNIYTDAAPLKITLKRAMARLEVRVDANYVNNFKLQDVYFVGMNKKGYVAPAILNGIVQNKVMNIPDGSGVKSERSLQDAIHINGLSNTGATLYVPETLLSSTSGSGGPLRNICLVVTGETQILGDKNYGNAWVKGSYRLDFLLKNSKKEEELDVYRNTRYVFNIEAVHEYGSKTAEEALSAPVPHNATKVIQTGGYIVVGDTFTEEDCIEMGLNDITSDGQTYIAVNSSELLAERSDYQGLYYAKIQIFTNNEGGWRMIDLPNGFTSQRKEGGRYEIMDSYIWIDPTKIEGNNSFYIIAGGVWKFMKIKGLPGVS